MSKKFYTFFFPCFIILYLIISLLPKVDFLNSPKTEYFPIFGFDLYSFMPNNFTRYDFVFNKDTEKEYFLFYNNKSNTEVQKKYYQVWLAALGSSYENGKSINIEVINNISEKENTVHFVKLYGQYSKLIKDDEYDLIVLKKIK